ncbi:hypothetical protein B0J13DRAFT_234812 [Dactylonectria estremocensis]|uniref:Zn(2)-C6 fungal-type domain-containing protein n=1 Tax=Dactylonectria estremocensis TaxID=1079267 RepID=A0A9P9F8P8_9HYPO|nr:hypothetical protein B0J13DRAFT_234812 [Dactylonectria estremocensis]
MGESHQASPLVEAPASKRRKLRKGTQSCWECRRRKARCTFAAGEDDVCQGCRRRGTACLSQEFPDRPSTPGSNRHIVDRLDQVEALVGQLVKAASNETDGPPTRRSPVPDTADASLPRRVSSSNSEEVRLASTTLNQPPTVVQSKQLVTVLDQHHDICQQLLAAWPSQQDINLILSIPADTSSIIHAKICSQTANLTGLAFRSSKALLQLPPPGSHPVLIARQLLVLGNFLQGTKASSAAIFQNLSRSCDEIMTRAVKTAHGMVTCNDELVASVEGIECIMLEGLYENYSGDLRRSWLAARRAIMIAQMLGLNRGVKPTSLTGVECKPDHMWFRLIQFDRYLSLMLGHPQSSLEDCFASPEALEPCSASERMQRLTCVAAGRILQRSPAGLYDTATTKGIDKMLRDASSVMPAQWWVAPILSTCCGPVETIRETLRLNDQFVHYHLLIQLHLPYLLQQGSGHEYGYNRMTAVTASREILSRFLSFHPFRSADHDCPGVDILVFVSSTALCLAHISDRARLGNDEHGFHFLAHQRLSDRGILERVLDSMQKNARTNNAAIATRVSTLLEHLLPIEEDVVAGGVYTASFVPRLPEEEDLGCKVTLSDDGAGLSVYLPYFPVFRIKREQETSQTISSGDHVSLASYSMEAGVTQRLSGKQPLRTTSGDELNFPLIASTTWQNIPSPQLIETNSLSTIDDTQSMETQGTGVLQTEQGTGEAIWAHQDVDSSFLDSLFYGNAGLEALDA